MRKVRDVPTGSWLVAAAAVFSAGSRLLKELCELCERAVLWLSMDNLSRSAERDTWSCSSSVLSRDITSRPE